MNAERNIRAITTLSALGMAVLIALSVLLSVLMCAWDADTYGAKSRAALTGMNEDEMTAYIGMDAQTQQACAECIRDYFTGRASDMDFILPDGTHAFGEKELSHMQDVRGLLTLGVRVALALAAALAAMGFACVRLRRRCAPRDAAQALCRGMKRGAGVLIVCALAVVLSALANFRAVFELFHRVAFSNENWLLDPRTDRLIRMMPQQLFETLCVEIALRAPVIPLAAAVAAGAHQYALKRKRETDNELHGKRARTGGRAQGKASRGDSRD